MFRLFGRREKTREAAGKTSGTFSRLLGGLFARQTLDEEFWNGLEEVLIIADVGMATSERLLASVRQRAREQRLDNPAPVRAVLRDEIEAILKSAAAGKSGPPEREKTAILVVGVNGVGKTTSIAKLAHAARSDGRTVLLAAADTFRAGAIEQLATWAGRLGVDVIAHQAGGDPGAVAFDAMAAAQRRGVELVLIDTAGRLHTKHNLMQELKKVHGSVQRQGEGYAQRVLLVMDGTTGQNGLVQAKAFSDAIGCDGVFLTKLDGTAKGGIVLAIAGELKLPVWFIGTGEKLEDLAEFDPEAFAEALVPEPAA
ncbi:MAG: signal recognition particle-docking protein FtsY [Chloroflexi bacterium]|nr:signal recognition particle-docking protein FtsY [Chloroflexota bacterium]